MDSSQLGTTQCSVWDQQDRKTLETKRRVGDIAYNLRCIVKRAFRRILNPLGLCLFILCLTLLIFEPFWKSETGIWNLQSSSQPTVQLILAARKNTNIAWTRQLTLPNVEVITYITDDANATHHSPINRGNEAMVYLTYLYEFYDKLPDIAIFTHGSDAAWHIDGALDYSTAYAIEHLDLNEVIRRKYLNLRVSWQWACPAWINTSVTALSPEFDENLRPEEPFMKAAFEQNFPRDEAPPILSQPCCSQFAVSKKAMLSVSRERYKLQIQWLQETELESDISGRVWERLWQWQFLKMAIDCPLEYESLCRGWHICFEDEDDWVKWKTHEAARYEIIQHMRAMVMNGVQGNNEDVLKLGLQVKEYDSNLQPWREQAIERGRSEMRRMKLL